jgi:4,5-DOPA dioxygenase extradiol
MPDRTGRMPVVFFGHGSPMNTLLDNHYTQAWAHIGSSLPRPKAILSVSAHWYRRGTAVTAVDRPQTIHDFAGFPRELFEVHYPAPGDLPLCERIRALLAPVDVAMDQTWGIDHGTWSVLRHAFPKADIPVVQLAIDKLQPAAFHYDLGQRLAPLRDEGVLILGSGNAVHNLRTVRWEPGAAPYEWAERFNEFVRQHVTTRDHTPLVDYGAAGNDARLSIPTPDHYLPLLYTLALHQPGEAAAFAVDGIENGSVGMLSVVIGGR